MVGLADRLPKSGVVALLNIDFASVPRFGLLESIRLYYYSSLRIIKTENIYCRLKFNVNNDDLKNYRWVKFSNYLNPFETLSIKKLMLSFAAQWG